MPHGGARPGAGRPKGVPNRVKAGGSWPAYPDAKAPLDYMLAVMRDPTVDPRRRDAMAKAAAPYVHPRIGEQKLDRRSQQVEAAKAAASGRYAVPSAPGGERTEAEEWIDLLENGPDRRRSN